MAGDVMTDEAMQEYLQSTEFIESTAPAIVELAKSLQRATDNETAVALFDWVRDNIHYDPYRAMDPPPRYRATSVLENGRGYCIQKAVLLTALCRAAGIPTRLAFADVRNHKSPKKMLELMGTNLFVYHGFVEIYLGVKWVKATPAFDEETSRKSGVLPVSLDGDNDAMFHPVDPEGHPFIEYVRSRGSHADLPLAEIQRVIMSTYSPLFNK